MPNACVRVWTPFTARSRGGFLRLSSGCLEILNWPRMPCTMLSGPRLSIGRTKACLQTRGHGSFQRAASKRSTRCAGARGLMLRKRRLLSSSIPPPAKSRLRAALDYVRELTKEKKVDPATFARTARHYSEREICEIVWLVASEHLYNMTNIGLNIHSDMLCDISTKGKQR